MSPLKFVVWDKNTKSFDNPYRISISGSGWIIEEVSQFVYKFLGQPENFIILRFTGKYDRFKKEVYEGDILKIKFSSEAFVLNSPVDFSCETIFEVYWAQGNAGFALMDHKERQSIFNLECVSSCEIIGNKFENPELLGEVMKTIEGINRPIKMWADKVMIEDEAIQQAKNLSSLPFIYKWIALMPDAHMGIGSTIGSVIATDKAIIPASVGVDIGCGMIAVQTSLKAEDLPESLKDIRHQIERDVPVGFNKYTEKNLPNDVCFKNADFNLRFGYRSIIAKYPEIETKDSPAFQLGTLGGGNHFIEICLDQDKNVWIMLHSGSRGIGNRIGRFFIEKAKEEMDKYFISLPDKDLSYLSEDTELFDSYVHCVNWAQEYAAQNRNIMLNRIITALQRLTKPFNLINEAINCHHNYVQKENHYYENIWVTRKGAVSARKGQLGIIPGSMGTKSYIVEGLGNPESFQSCSHGAGRSMSRTKARAQFNIADLERSTSGVECRKDIDIIDEIPMAYKDVDAVMASQIDLVKPIAVLKQILCVKG